MVFRLKVSRRLDAQGWKVKIRDKERTEPPHVTVIRRTRAWRYGLRNHGFLDLEPSPREVPVELVAEIRAAHDELVEAWDRMYPENPVSSPERDDE